MKTDLQLKHDVEQELSFDPRINAAHVGVRVDHGAVTLMGTVDTFGEKWAIEDATKKVSGVRTIAQDLTVKTISAHERSDSEIAAAVDRALEWNVYVPETVKATVQKGSVTLDGHASWHFEREAAEGAVRNLRGVVQVFNSISLKPQAPAEKLTVNVETALRRQSVKDAKSIHVTTEGGQVTLSGTVSSWQAIRDANEVAWAAPGVTLVIDHLTCRCRPERGRGPS